MTSFIDCTRFNKFYALLLVFVLLVAGCTTARPTGSGANTAQHSTEQHSADDHAEAGHTPGEEKLPALAAVTLGAGEKLQVVASTNLVADVVAQIGGNHITLHTLMGPGVDPHSYSTTPQDLRTVAEAQVVFINGLQLEAALADLLGGLTAPVVPVSAGITPRIMSEEQGDEENAAAEEHHHEGGDPHTWQAVANVKIWVANIEESLRQLDPANAEAYHTAAEAYLAALDALEAEIQTQLATIPPERRKLVTDHETFGYFADAYGFTIVGALIPSLSTAAEPSAQALAQLQDLVKAEGVKAIFVGATVSPRLAEQMAQDLGIGVVSLYSDSLSAPDGPAATYLDFMRYNVNAIVQALQP